MVSTTNSFTEVTNLFYDRISSQITSVTLTNGSIVTVKTVSFAFPDKDIMDKTDFPIIVIDNSDASDETLVYGKTEITNRLIIECVATSTEALSILMSTIYDTIKTNTSTFFASGVTKISLIDKDSESDLMGGLKVRRGMLSFEVTWRRTK
jgi:hypothetical protein